MKYLRVNLGVELGGVLGADGWAKLVTSVDRSKDTGYAFEGTYVGKPFLPRDKLIDIVVGSVVVVKTGRMENNRQYGGAYYVDTDAGMPYLKQLRHPTSLMQWWDWRMDFLNFRDFVAGELDRLRVGPRDEDPLLDRLKELAEEFGRDEVILTALKLRDDLPQKLVLAAPRLVGMLADLLQDHESMLRSELEGTSMFAGAMNELEPIRELLREVRSQ